MNRKRISVSEGRSRKPVTDVERRQAAKEFSERWTKKLDDWENNPVNGSNEVALCQPFWMELIKSLFGIEHPVEDGVLHFNKPIKDADDPNTVQKNGAIDVYVPSTKIIIEQKGSKKDLSKKYPQSDGTMLTPYRQADRYDDTLPQSEKARWIITSNFREIRIYDMDTMPRGSVHETIRLEDLAENAHRLQFLVNVAKTFVPKETEISIEAGAIVANLYDRLLSLYKDADSAESKESLNILSVRLVFCMYAEDAEIFDKQQFHDYVEHFSADELGDALDRLFQVLDTPEDKRKQSLSPILAAFPYVNGGLFRRSDVEIPLFDDAARDELFKASATFDWARINPTVFGAIFESTLNPQTRRQGGMHYTSIANIHKVIDPLFLDDLEDELEQIITKMEVYSAKHEIGDAKTKNLNKRKVRANNKRIEMLEQFRTKLASLRILDPACGSGNFLTETYLSLRRLENRALAEIHAGQQMFGHMIDPIKVQISQFHGIEINDFAVSVAQTALWIAESQMMQETEDIVNQQLDFLPLATAAHIVEGNALRMDWNDVVPKDDLNYIIGNPPFRGARNKDDEQKKDLIEAFGDRWKNVGNLDYVAGWFKKATDYMQRTRIRAAFVATNSIAQGESVGTLWEPLFKAGAHIDFAWQTFQWDSEAKSKAQVHVVVIGFSDLLGAVRRPVLYGESDAREVEKINGYLTSGSNVGVKSRQNPLCDVPNIGIGNQPIDGGYYLFTEEEKDAFIKEEPSSEAWFHPWYGAVEFINQKPRWCLWLGKCSPSQLRSMPKCVERIHNVQEYRRASIRENTRRLAETPTRFQVENMPNAESILIPRVSSERRQYVPIGYLNKDDLASDAVHLLPNASMYLFGILTSNVHNAWMRTVAGRLKSDYRYSKDIVYNNFPWPNPTPAQKERIEKTAQAILDARALYPDSSLADLYDEVTMHPELRKAHQENDRAVMAAYGFSKDAAEPEIVERLMQMYAQLIAEEQERTEQAKAQKKSRKKKG